MKQWTVRFERPGRIGIVKVTMPVTARTQWVALQIALRRWGLDELDITQATVKPRLATVE